MIKKWNYTQHLQLFSVLLAFLFCSVTFGQTQTGKFTHEGRQFNLPPGAKFYPKKFKFIDYSVKFAKEANEPLKKNFMEEFSQEDMENFKTIYQEDYLYYQEALRYFEKLSDRVMRTYTVNELWYIYIYDQALKTNLLHF